MHPELPYAPSLALATDLYQLTMAQAYLRSGTADHEAVFHLFFRKPPYGGGFTVACGIAPAAAWVEQLRFDADDRAYLATLTGNDGAPLFGADFLDWLADFRFAGSIEAVEEGEIVYPHAPLLRVRGPLAHCQLVETALLNLINFQTLIATRSARVALAARGAPVLEFGLRRAQGLDGGLSASRAAYVGGAAATSNVLAGRLLGIPVRGTHAHSWVMSFSDELESFRAYAAAMPNNCVFLVDTYDTLAGVDHAITIGRELRERGHKLGGVRLDSGDLAALSIAARKKLDDAGFPDAVVVASNDLDERLIESLQHQGAAIGVWGVGTRLATGGEQAALGGVYKLGGIRSGPDAPWEWRIKVSEQPIKISTPGILQVRRVADERGGADVIWNEGAGPLPEAGDALDLEDPIASRGVASFAGRDLLHPLFVDGVRVRPAEPLSVARDRALAGVAALVPGQKRFDNPRRYPVYLEAGLMAEKLRLVRAARGAAK